MMYITPIIEYLCPACGNPYYGSSIASYSVFNITSYSDGSSDMDFSLWLTRCPRCKSFFAKEHLFRFPLAPRVSQFIRYEASEIRACRSERARAEERRRERLYGSCDDPYWKNESRLEFLESAMERGLYFSPIVSEWDRAKKRIDLYRSLWWEYNRKRKKTDDEKYLAFCKDFIENLLNVGFYIEQRELMLAELYRNIGCFEESLKWLERVRPQEDTEAYVDCIKRQIELGNKKTAAVNKNDKTAD